MSFFVQFVLVSTVHQMRPLRLEEFLLGQSYHWWLLVVEVQVWGSGAIGVVKAGGTIDASAGRALTTPATSAAGAAGTLIALTLDGNNALNHIADYLGHFGEDIEVGKVPTDAAIGDEIVVRFR